MKKSILVFALAVLIATFGSGMAFAQSSGNFNYAYNQTECVDPSGALSGGIPPDRHCLLDRPQGLEWQRQRVRGEAFGCGWPSDRRYRELEAG